MALQEQKIGRYELIERLGANISIALENARLHLDSIEKQRIEKNLELAQAIQDGLMPPIPKNVAGLDVHGWFRPAEQTSGDFYDFLRYPDGRVTIALGDVAVESTSPGGKPAASTPSTRASPFSRGSWSS